MRCSPFAVAILGAVGFVAPLSAQGRAANPAPDVAPGERIRVRAVGLAAPTETTTQTGTIGQVRGDTISFRPDGNGPDASRLTAVPVGHIERLDISRGEHGHALVGLGLGTVGGAAVGAGLGALAPLKCVGFCLLNTRRDHVFLGMGIGAVAGLVTGGIVGALIHTERWARVLGYPAARVSVVPLGSGVGVGYALALNF